MNFAFRKERGRAAVILDMTPLIDVVFLLLIFFLITTTFIRNREDAVPINLPSGTAEALPQESGESITITVDATGRYTVSRQDETVLFNIAFDDLRTELQTYHDTNPDLQVLLRGDRDVSYGAIMDVWLMAGRIGFQQVQAVVERQPPEEQPNE